MEVDGPLLGGAAVGENAVGEDQQAPVRAVAGLLFQTAHGFHDGAVHIRSDAVALKSVDGGGAGVHGVEDGALNDFAAHGGDDHGVTLAHAAADDVQNVRLLLDLLLGHVGGDVHQTVYRGGQLFLTHGGQDGVGDLLGIDGNRQASVFGKDGAVDEKVILMLLRHDLVKGQKRIQFSGLCADRGAEQKQKQADAS